MTYDKGLRTNDKKCGEKMLFGGKHIGKEVIRKMLSNVFYTGKFFWKGQLYDGKHEALVSMGMFDHVQRLLTKRRNGAKGSKKNLLFKGLIRCGECGRMVVGETQGPYIYYRCTLWEVENNLSCSQKKYIQEGAIEDEILKHLGEFTMPPDLLASLKEELTKKYDQTIEANRKLITELEKQKDALETRIEQLTNMRANRELDTEEYIRLKEKNKKDLLTLQDQITSHQQFDIKAFKKSIDTLDVAKNPKTMWFRFDTEEKRKLMNYLFSNLLLKDKTLMIMWNKPFDLLLKYKVSTDSSG
jgi:hypothetical protein